MLELSHGCSSCFPSLFTLRLIWKRAYNGLGALLYMCIYTRRRRPQHKRVNGNYLGVNFNSGVCPLPLVLSIKYRFESLLNFLDIIYSFIRGKVDIYRELRGSGRETFHVVPNDLCNYILGILFWHSFKQLRNTSIL